MPAFSSRSLLLFGLPLTVVFTIGPLAHCSLGQAKEPAKKEPTKKEVQDLLASPSADLITPTFLQPAVKQAVANGLAVLLARITVEGNEHGLPVPPAQTMKLLEWIEVPAKKVTVDEPIYEHEYAEIEKIVPVMESGQPTGRFTKVREKVIAKTRQIGKRPVERLVPDPNGSEKMNVPKYGPGGPAAWMPGVPGLNGMALHVLAKAGLGGHPAVKKLAGGLAEHADEFNGLPDSTFDVAWMAAGFAALGPDSPHAGVARRLIDKLVDGQVREKGSVAGLWGPVCVNYGYYGKLMTLGQTVRQELDVNIPKQMQTASPADQERLVAMGREMKAVSVAYEKVHRDVFRAGTRMLAIQAAYPYENRAVLPGMPVNAYQWVVTDIESTDAAAFGLAASKRAGMLPRETERFAVRGKNIHPPVKTDATLKAAAKRMADVIDDDGGATTLAAIVKNNGFDNTGFPAPSFASDDPVPTMLDVQTACSCLAALDTIESLITAEPGLAKQLGAARKRARERGSEIAARWYVESANPAAEPWRGIYRSMKLPHEAIKKSAKVPWPSQEKEKPTVDSIPWGTAGSLYRIVPDFRALFSEAASVKDRYENDLFRQIAFRIISLQDANGQWSGYGSPIFSTASESLTMNRLTLAWHKALNRDPPGQVGQPDPIPYESMLHPEAAGWTPGGRPDPASFPTLASLLFLLDAVEGPVSLDGIGILPVAADEPPKQGEAGKPVAPPTPADVARKVIRPNVARQELLDSIVALRWRTPAADAKEDAKPADDKEGDAKEGGPTDGNQKDGTQTKGDDRKNNDKKTKKDEKKKDDVEEDDGLGKFEDLLKPSK